jgi:hypothetical protein
VCHGSGQLLLLLQLQLLLLLLLVVWLLPRILRRQQKAAGQSALA